VAKENDILLPALLASERRGPAELLAGMHRRTVQAAQASPAEAAAAADPQATVLSCCCRARRHWPGRAGRPACRLAAGLGGAARAPPDLASR